MENTNGIFSDLNTVAEFYQRLFVVGILGAMMDDAAGFVPLSQKPMSAPKVHEPFPMQALRGGPGAAPLIPY